MHLKKTGFRLVFFLLLNTFTAAAITLITAVAFQVGKGFSYEAVAGAETAEVPEFMDTIVALFPQNLMSQWGEGQVVPVVIFAVIIAVAYNQYGKDKEEVKVFKAFIDAGNKVLGQAIGWIMGFTPYAVLSLIARAVGRVNVADLVPLLGMLVLSYVLCGIQMFGVESLLIRFVGKLNPVKFIKGIAPAGIVAFTSQSSVGTIPVTARQLEKELGVDEDVASFAAGLGANLGMPGCAGVWPMLLAVFAIHVLGMEYSVMEYGVLIVLAMVVALGTVGVPGAGTIAATALFSTAGLPVEIIVLLTPISTLVDMVRTATNVVGSATAAVLVAEKEGLLNREIYNGERSAVTSGEGAL